MGKQIPPEIITEPTEKIVFNAPFKEKKTYTLCVTNPADVPLAWCIKSTNNRRITFSPPTGVLQPNESSMIHVSTETFDPTPDNLKDDSMTIEWILAPDGEGKNFNREWMQRNVVVRRKHINVLYNQ